MRVAARLGPPRLVCAEIDMKENMGRISGPDLRRILSAGAVPLAFAGAALLVALFATAPRAQDNDKVAAGLATWKGAGCVDCHGPFADGDRDDDDFPIGANLRTTKLDAALLKSTIRCGRPGTGMPAFDDEAYITRECYGRPLGVRPGNLQPTPRMLALDEIDLIIAYLQGRIIGRGKITRQECLAYYDDQPDTCEDYK
jgi:mono/diheme cytochrome c family protein